MEDIDTPRVVPGCAQSIMDDLRWLGLDWDEGPVLKPKDPYVQSHRLALYQEAIDRLHAADLTFLCDCSRAEIARVASAPHPGEDAPVYPGTCRSAPANRTFRRSPSVRLAVPRGTVTVQDTVLGPVTSNVSQEVGDFVLRRGDGLFSYQLAVVVDDLAMGITEVVRGADLRSSAPRQVLIARLLGGTPPSYAHTPLVVQADGSRLAKRSPSSIVGEYRRAGANPQRVVACLARALGLAQPHETALWPADLVQRFDWSVIPQQPIHIAID